jgi:hypothetical protein
MDRWKRKELKQMELGGNAKAKEFYRKNGMIKDGEPPDHKNPALTKYKLEIKNSAARELGLEETKEEVPPPKVEEQKPVSNQTKIDDGK